MGPTEAEIDAVIFDMIAAEAARVPADTNLDDLWSSVARDAYGQFQGYGFGYTPAEAWQAHGLLPGGQSVTYGPFRVSCRKAGRSRPTRPVKGRCSRSKPPATAPHPRNSLATRCSHRKSTKPSGGIAKHFKTVAALALSGMRSLGAPRVVGVPANVVSNYHTRP